MISYNSRWLAQRKGGKWYNQGVVNSAEASLEDAKKAIISQLKENGFYGDIVFKEPAALAAAPSRLEIFRIKKDGVENMLLEDKEPLEGIYNTLKDDSAIEEGLKKSSACNAFKS